jgi:hypothetical protein
VPSTLLRGVDQVISDNAPTLPLDEAMSQSVVQTLIPPDVAQALRANQIQPRRAAASGELIGEVPGTQVTWFQAQEKVVGGAVRIGGTGIVAEVARRDPQHCIGYSRGD